MFLALLPPSSISVLTQQQGGKIKIDVTHDTLSQQMCFQGIDPENKYSKYIPIGSQENIKYF